MATMSYVDEAQILARARTFEVQAFNSYALFYQIDGAHLIPMVENLDTGFAQYPCWDPASLSFVETLWDSEDIPSKFDQIALSAAWAAFLVMSGKLTIEEILS